MEKFNECEMPMTELIKIVGGNNGGTTSEVPLTTLGTISNDGDG